MKKRTIITGIIVIVVAGLWWGAEKWVAKRLAHEFTRAADGQMELSIGLVGINIFRNEVVFSGIEAEILSRTTASQGPGRLVKTARRNRMFIAGRILIDGFSYSGDKLTVGELRIRKPRLRRGNGVRVGLVALNRRDTVEGIVFGQGRLAVSRMSLRNIDQSVHFSADSLVIDSTAHRISLKALTIDPTYPKEEFTRMSWRHGDWTRFTTGAIDFSGVDFKGMKIDSIHIAGGSISSFKDRKLSFNTAQKPMYHEILQKIYSHVVIRTAAFENISARYEELPVRGDEPGTFTADGVSGTLTASDTEIGWSAVGHIMGSGSLTASGTIPLEGDRFELSGVLHECPAEIFNPMATPLGNIEIRTGRLQRLDFSMSGDSVQARSQVVLVYDSLTVELLNRHHKDRKLLSEIVNDILPNTSEATGSADGEFARDPQRSPWNYIWKTIFAAVKHTVIKS